MYRRPYIQVTRVTSTRLRRRDLDRERRGGGNQYPVDFSGDVPFKTPHDLPPGLSLRGSTCDVAAGALVDAHAHHADKVQGAIGVPVPAPVEAVTHDLTG